MRDDNEDGTPTGGPVRVSAASKAASAEAGRKPRGVPYDEQADTGEMASVRPVSADMQQFIGRQLRAVFDDVARQPVPDRFLELMKQLDSKTGAR